MKKFCLIVLLAYMLAVVPALADGIPGDANADNILTEDELANAICSYMLDGGNLQLEDLRDGAHVYAFWNGEPKSITDSVNRTVTFYKPTERVILINSKSADILRAFGMDLEDKVVGVTNYILKNPEYYPELQDKPGFDFNELNYEKIAALNSDLLITYGSGQKYTDTEKLEKLGVKVLFLDLHGEEYLKSVKKFGYLFDREERAEESLQWSKSYEDQVTSRTANLGEEEKPKVLWLGYPDYYYPTFKVRTSKSGDHPLIVKAGGINIAANLTGGSSVEVSGEWIVKENPDIIIADVLGGDYTGYSVDKTEAISNMKEMQNTLINDSALNTTNAVKNGSVYVMCTDLNGGGLRPAGLAYLAKYFHPELFDDVQPKSIIEEFYESWQGVPYQGAYVYPSP